MKKPRVIFHVDVNSAFLSWESVDRLSKDNKAIDLRTIDSVIGGDQNSRHGIVLAKSTSAKKYGIVTGEPLTKAIAKCPNLVIVPPNFKVYSRYSQSLIQLLSEYTPTLSQFSIDEAFLDMSESWHLFGQTPVEVAQKIRSRIASDLNFTVNIGISANKLLAKMASDFKKPNLCHTLFPEEIPTKMWPLPVEELFFVGPSTKNRFYSLGIRTIYDLAHSDLNLLKLQLGNKYASLIYDYANGIDEEPVEVEEEKSKGCGNSITLATDVIDTETAKQVLLALSETVASRLRQSNLSASCITIEIKYADFHKKSHQMTLPEVTNVTNDIYHAAYHLFLECWDHSPIRLLGVRASKFDEKEFTQLSLFQAEKSEKLTKLDSAIDSIRHKFGTDAVKRASFLKGDAICKHRLGNPEHK